MIEKYEKMPAYESKQAFLTDFFIPVVLRVWKSLQKNGHMALNMPKEMYEAVKGDLPRVKKLPLPLSNRHPTNAARRGTLGKIDKERHEWIYVWHKK